jgi:hypothetical protein
MQLWYNSSEGGHMKLAEKIDFAFDCEQKFHNSYSFVDKDLRVKEVKNQKFVVPWQIDENIKRKSYSEIG